ncbi:MAG: hypothetical protein D6703_04805 [Zetaproteobacteria bacterium]|nr:MAG: hypothetical protein D6703_04805 [Zetaproteobacteria bacterium]
MNEVVYLNGIFLPLEDARVHIEDRGFQFADGVYEVIACIGGTFLDMELHLERFYRSATAIGISPPVTKRKLGELAHQLYLRNAHLENATIYIQLTRGRAPRSHIPPVPNRPTLALTARKLELPDDTAFTQGIRAITIRDMRWQRCDIKSIALLPNVLGRMEARRSGAEEAFWVDNNGHILEGCSSNVLAVIDQTLVTHPLDNHVLGGITRHLCLQLAKHHGIAIQERAWHPYEAGMEECMVTSTSWMLLPVHCINERQLPSPGPITQQLRHWLMQHLASLSKKKTILP